MSVNFTDSQDDLSVFEQTDEAVLHAVNNGIGCIEHGNLVSRDVFKL
jgi:hypothetical protein